MDSNFYHTIIHEYVVWSLEQAKSWSITKRRARQDANHYKQVGSARRFNDMMLASYLKLIFRLHATPAPSTLFDT